MQFQVRRFTIAALSMVLIFVLGSALLWKGARGTVRPPGGAPTSMASQSAPTPSARPDFGKLPLAFEPNVGQFDSEVKFLARSQVNVFLTTGEAVFTPRDQPSNPFRMQFLGANSVEPLGMDQLPGKANYFIGKDASKWRTAVSTFGKVAYPSLYPGVDLVFRGNPRQLEYDFVLAPGADVGEIRLAFPGSELRLGAEGDLVLASAGSELNLRRPRIYQEGRDGEREISGGYALTDGGQVTFFLGEYDPTRPLVIDPILVYSSYLGGSDVDFGTTITVDRYGYAYIGGFTTSPNFPLVNAPQQTASGGDDAFISRVDVDGSSLVYSTYLGGLKDDDIFGITVDEIGSVYVTGNTASADFPTTPGAFQPASGGGVDAFVTRLSPDGATLLYSTYLGGSLTDAGDGIAIDAHGRAHVIGHTQSANFPLAQPLQPALAGGYDVFLAVLNPTGSALEYSTYFGGTGNDFGAGIAVDAAGNNYLVGETNSTNFPTSSPLQAANGGGRDAFVAKILSNGATVAYATYLGGNGDDSGTAIAVDGSGSAYVVGETASGNFPLAAALQPTLKGPADGFISKVSPNGSSLVYSTYLGGSGTDSCTGIGVDAAGVAYLVGFTDSVDFPTVSAVQATNKGGLDAFVSTIDSAGSTLQFSTYLGGAGTDVARGMALDNSLNVYVAGGTTSTDLTLLNPFQPTYGGGFLDAFVAKLGSTEPRILSINPTSGPASGGTTLVVEGANFRLGANSSVGGVSSKVTVVNGATTIIALTGPHAPGAVDVQVTNPDGSTSVLPGAFTYQDDKVKHSGGCATAAGGPAPPAAGWVILAALAGRLWRRARRGAPQKA